MELTSPKFRSDPAKPGNQKIHIFCLLRGSFSNISAKEKSFLYLPFKEENFYKLKYFLIIIVKCFFSFYNIFSILIKLLFLIF